MGNQLASEKQKNSDLQKDKMDSLEKNYKNLKQEKKRQTILLQKLEKYKQANEKLLAKFPEAKEFLP